MVKRSGMKKWVSMNKLLAVAGLLLIIAAAAVMVHPLYVGSGGEYEPEYPFPVQDKIYQPVWGAINCQHTGGTTAVTQPTPYECGDWLIGKLCVDYQCEYIGGCKLRSVSGSCPTGSWNFDSRITIGSSSYEYSLPLDLDYGQTVHIMGICLTGVRKQPETLDIDIVGYQSKLYIESYGYTQGGWLAGSDNCKLVSVDAATLKQMQDKSADELKGIEQIQMGVTEHIIVGWREDPAFGTVNPCGKYNGQDVVCRPYDKLASLKKVYTEGNRNYWTVDEVIETYAQNNQLCCCAGDCAAGYECEAYHCVEKPIICEYGQCPWGIEQCHHVSGCFQEGGKFYLRQAYCDPDKCCQYTENEVKCCKNYCDAMSTPTKSYYCDYDVGCVEVTIPKECPAGHCCMAGGEYKTQNCLLGLQCCMELGSEYMGVCKEQCGDIPPVDDCYQNCVADAECGLGITVDGFFCRAGCQVKCWFYDNIWWFVGGTVLGVLLLLFMVFKRASPQMQVAKMAYGAAVKRK